MYRRRSEGWIKHVDFIAIDIVCLHISLCLAYYLWVGNGILYQEASYLSLSLFLTLILFLTALLGNTMTGITRRGYWQEIKNCAKTAIILILASSLFLFSLKISDVYSRMVVYLSTVFFFCISTLAHYVWKGFIRKNRSGRMKDSMLVAANAEQMLGVLAMLNKNSYGLPSVRGLIVLDGEAGMEGFPYQVVANQRTMTEYITRNWVDELLVQCGDRFDKEENRMLQKELNEIANSGVTVHKILFEDGTTDGHMRMVERFGGYMVVTDSIRIVTLRQAILKRCLDIAGGLVGTVLAGLVLLAVGPIIYIKSPGPIIFKQTRIGRNGKQFKMYKIRSMCLDADEKKKELVAANLVSDGMMFKLENDPRIIGSELLPDGTYRKGIGNFIRDYSLDELPQFLNVLKGEMSLVGTRPPTLDEWEKYKPYHRARMTFRPGITGLWQISGRSDITDFEEVIRLDMEYINRWRGGLDLRIMLETVLKVLKKDGAK